MNHDSLEHAASFICTLKDIFDVLCQLLHDNHILFGVRDSYPYTIILLEIPIHFPDIVVTYLYEIKQHGVVEIKNMEIPKPLKACKDLD